MSLAVPQGSPRERAEHPQGRLLSWTLGRDTQGARKENQGGVAGLLAHSLLRQLCALSMACSAPRGYNQLQAPGLHPYASARDQQTRGLSSSHKSVGLEGRQGPAEDAPPLVLL